MTLTQGDIIIIVEYLRGFIIMNFKKIIKVISVIAALVAVAAAVYVAVQKLTAKKQPEYFDDNDFFECDNEIEIVEVENEPEAEEAAKEEPKKKAAPKKNNKRPAKADAE